MLIDVTKSLEEIHEDIAMNQKSVQLPDFKIWMFGNIPDMNKIRQVSDMSLKKWYSDENLIYVRTIDVKNDNVAIQVLE